MASLEPVAYVETTALLKNLGYDPGAIERDSLRLEGYSDGVQQHQWVGNDWPRIEAAMRRDEKAARVKASREHHASVQHPKHYTSHPSGIEVIEITRHESFLRGNVLKYVLRAPHKGAELEDLQKAAQYLAWEIERVESAQKGAA